MLADQLLQGVAKVVFEFDVDGTGAVLGSGSLSTPVADLLKNYALCLVRLHNVLLVALKFPASLTQSPAEPVRSILPADRLLRAVKDASWVESVRERAASTVNSFLRVSPTDPDGEALHASIKMSKSS